MTTRTTPPFRADHVGSFLRPEVSAWRRASAPPVARSRCSAGCARSRIDCHHRGGASMQEDAGLQVASPTASSGAPISILDFLEQQLQGVDAEHPTVTVTRPDGTRGAVAAGHESDRARCGMRRDIQLADFQYLKQPDAARAAPRRSAIPSPTMLHFRGGRAGISERALSRISSRTSIDDVANAYGDELKFARRRPAATYVQMDDTNLAYLCDEHMREAARQPRRRSERVAAPLCELHQPRGGAASRPA